VEQAACTLHAQDMTSHAYGNPHTDAGGGGPAGSDVLIERARNETLAMCNVSPAEYDCVFTSGATGAAVQLMIQRRSLKCRKR
jgi:cysteine sulfinate desulfinase/cysteine desulfurase-like protein